MASWNGKYFVGGLDRDLTTNQSLAKYFELFGELTDAVVMVKDGRSRGFGFVTYANPSAVPPAFLTSIHVVDGKKVDVKSAVPEEEARGQAAIKKLFIGGLTSTTTKELLEAHFSQFGGIHDAVVMSKDGVPRGFGFVTFNTPEEADFAVAAVGGHNIDGKMVDVKKAEPKPAPGAAKLAMGPGQAQAGYPMANPYGAFAGYPGYSPFAGAPIMPSRAPGPMRNTPRPATHGPSRAAASLVYGSTENPHSNAAKIFVGGLPRDCTEDSLVVYFSNFGSIVGCEIMRRDGQARGFGFVVFATDQEAAMAMAHPRHVIDGKQVECKPCTPKSAEPPAHHRPAASMTASPMMGHMGAAAVYPGATAMMQQPMLAYPQQAYAQQAAYPFTATGMAPQRYQPY